MAVYLETMVDWPLGGTITNLARSVIVHRTIARLFLPEEVNDSGEILAKSSGRWLRVITGFDYSSFINKHREDHPFDRSTSSFV